MVLCAVSDVMAGCSRWSAGGKRNYFSALKFFGSSWFSQLAEELGIDAGRVRAVLLSRERRERFRPVWEEALEAARGSALPEGLLAVFSEYSARVGSGKPFRAARKAG